MGAKRGWHNIGGGGGGSGGGALYWSLTTIKCICTHAWWQARTHEHTHLYLSTPWYKNSRCLKLLNHALVVLIPTYRYTMTWFMI